MTFISTIIMEEKFTDTDGNGMVNVDVSRLNTNDNGDLYATVVLDFYELWLR